MAQPRILLSRRALLHNMEALIKLSGGLKAFPVLKANAYGLGLKEVSRAFEDYSEEQMPYFCLARQIELKQLRDFGVKRKLLLLSEWPADFALIPSGCDLMVSCREDLLSLLQQKRPFTYHLKINTGMNRLGFRLCDLKSEESIADLVKLIQSAEKNGHVCEGICTHLASGEELPEKFSHKQLRAFQSFYESLEKSLEKNFKWVHGLNSPAVLKKLSGVYPFNSFRPGIHLWGVRDPEAPIDIAPVLQLRAPVRQLYWITKGESVGYGRRFTAEQDMRIAVLNLGYADGLRRDSWSRNLAFHFKGERAPLLGVISMDMCAVDCTHIQAEVAPSAEFEWIGPQQSVESIALALGTIPYEVLTSLSVRIERQLQL